MAENKWIAWVKKPYLQGYNVKKNHLELDLVDKFLLRFGIWGPPMTGGFWMSRVRHQQTNILNPSSGGFQLDDFSDAMGWKSLGSLIHVDVRGVSLFPFLVMTFPVPWNLKAVVCKMNHHQWCSELFAVSCRGRVLKKKSHKHIGIEKPKKQHVYLFCP